MNSKQAKRAATAQAQPLPDQRIARLAQSQDVASKVAAAFQARVATATRHWSERVRRALEPQAETTPKLAGLPWEVWTGGAQYAVDFTQRTLIFWDTLRQRGNNFIEHERLGLPPVLHFEHELVMDGRDFDRPVNYALLRILPPHGIAVDARSQPYVIIDPRGGHGPGIGGFKDDSQVGVALRAGHPVYFVVFFPHPEAGQTLMDVCNAERAFIKQVCDLHPEAPKPVIIGNCQGGWAAMMLAASSPDETGPVVVVGAPMSYWGGAWSEEGGDNPMRYAGGLLGGTWLASLSSDMGAGKFDGAWLVQNFENLNPANTFLDKYYRVFANIDTEPPRFLEFERWWGGYYLLNREEIEWITQNLFIGNRLWAGADQEAAGFFDLRDVKAPIVLFASMGDNITPPQQAFNWVADVYRSTEEIKLCGQVIVGLMHEDIGHLGIFVSGKVAKKEHAQIVSVLESIEALSPGLYGMQIAERTEASGEPIYDVSLVELQLEDVVKQLNRLERVDEKAFEAVKAVSEFNQRAYELFGRPWVQAFANESGADLLRKFHPMRWQRWVWSDLNPWTAWLAPAAKLARDHRQALAPEHPVRRGEAVLAELTSAALDGYKALRDASAEASFFQLYGQLYIHGLGEHGGQAASVVVTESTMVADALARIESGGYAQAVARVAFLLGHEDIPLPLSRLHLAQELIEEYHVLLPDLPRAELRRITGEQEIIARHARERAIDTLPALLTQPRDRKRLATLLERVLADARVQAVRTTSEQRATLARICEVLGLPVPTQPRRPAATSRRRAA